MLSGKSFILTFREGSAMRYSKRINMTFAAVLILSLYFLVSCAAKPHEETGFLNDYSNMQQTQNFHRFYIAPGVDFKAYKNVIIRPVNTTHLPEFKWYDERYDEKELKEIIRYMEWEFARALGKSYLIVNEDYNYKGRTLILELALVKLAPVDAASNVISSALIYIPVSKGEVAVEGRLVDADTGKTVLKFTDARHGKENIVNVKDFGRFMHAKDTINEWANELYGVMQMGEAEREGYFGGTFELKPWQ